MTRKRLPFSFLFFCCFFTLTAMAELLPVTLVFNDSHEERGFMHPFFTPYGSLLGLKSAEGEASLDYASLKFFVSEDAEPRSIPSSDIRELHLGSGTPEIYRALWLKREDALGRLVDTGKRIFLPLVRTRTKINLYGFEGISYNIDYPGGPMRRQIDTRFYLQPVNGDYAISYMNDLGIEHIFHIMEMVAGPLEFLFADCPELVKEVHRMTVDHRKIPREERKRLKKMMKAKRKEMKKSYYDLPKSVRRGNLALYFKYNCDLIDEWITRYETDCP